MKTLKLVRSIVCFMLVLAMMLLTVACKSNNDPELTYSEYWVTEEEIIEEDVPGGAGDTTSDGGAAQTGNKDTANKGDGSKDTATSDKDTSSLKGKTVKVLIWYDVPEREKSVSDAFTKKTGCKVQFVKTSVNNYQTKLASMVASGSAPDAAAIFAQNYPTLLIRGLFDPLKDNEFDFGNKLWDKSTMDLYKWNDKYYGVAAKGSMFADMWCVYYNKDLFEERGQKTPYEIWKANPDDWTWTKLRDVAKAMTYGTGTNKTYGLSVMYSKAFMLSTGKDFVNIAGTNITNTSKDGQVKKAWKFINDVLDVDKSMDRANSAVTDLVNRKAAMLIEGQYQMQSENTLKTQMKDAWGVAPFPKADGADKFYTPLRVCLWGIGKGAKNSAAAAEFLKYWLDIKNEVKEVYANDECREVHAWMWEQAKGVDFSTGVINFGGNTTNLIAHIMGGSENVDSTIDANYDSINADIAAVLGEIG